MVIGGAKQLAVAIKHDERAHRTTVVVAKDGRHRRPDSRRRPAAARAGRGQKVVGRGSLRTGRSGGPILGSMVSPVAEVLKHARAIDTRRRPGGD